MAKRRIFRRSLNWLTKRLTPSKRTKEEPKSRKRQRVADHIMETFVLADPDVVYAGVNYMSNEELRWTLKANPDEIRAKARQSADRMTDDHLPLNPWWYGPGGNKGVEAGAA